MVGPALTHWLGTVAGKLNRAARARLGRVELTGTERRGVRVDDGSRKMHKGKKLVPEGYKYNIYGIKNMQNYHYILIVDTSILSKKHAYGRCLQR